MMACPMDDSAGVHDLQGVGICCGIILKAAEEDHRLLKVARSHLLKVGVGVRVGTLTKAASQHKSPV